MAARWWKEIIISTQLRMAAGVCVLSTGFMIGGTGAIASADTGSADGSKDSSSLKSPALSHGPVATFADAVRKAVEDSLHGTVQTVTGALNSLAKPAGTSATSKSPKTTFGGSPTVHGSTAADPVPDVAPEAGPPVPADLPDAAPDTAEKVVGLPPPPPPAATPDPLVAATAAMLPVSHAVARVTDEIIALPAVVGSLPTSATPVTDVLASLQSVLTSVGDAGTSIYQLPNDLAGLLGVSASTPTATVGAASGIPTYLTAPGYAAPVPVGSALPSLATLLGIREAPFVDMAPAPVAVAGAATVGTAHGESSTSPVPTGSRDDGGNDAMTTVEHVLGAVVATVSLTALAATALPGILGLLSTCLAGIRVGYRQAKAASALPDTALARFVGSGPVGVVRSSSQVELRSRPLRVVRTPARDAGRARGLHVVGSTSTAQLLDEAV